jgi:phosphotransferase system  glucose/maltose/N-acetylglucosamine-specific IIC component
MCCVIACVLLVLVTAVLAFLLCAWVASWIGRTLAWADNMTGWLLANATEKICRGLTGTPRP